MSVFQKAILNELRGVCQKKLGKAAKELSTSYQKTNTFSFSSDVHRLAYLATRFPATLAVAKAVLDKLPKSPSSVLEFGAGIGTSLWVYPHLSKATLVEKDLGLIQIGQRLKPGPFNWTHSDFTQLSTFPEADLILFSYSIGEIEEEKAFAVLKRAFDSNCLFIVIIEPGTPKGFERIRLYRELFLSINGHIIAPCPHHQRCPMEGGNWCHFKERLERSRLHRLLKEGDLGYEDEKYSYLMISKQLKNQGGKRILRHPQKRRGHISFELCTENGLEKAIVSKKEGKKFKEAKELDWGDLVAQDFF